MLYVPEQVFGALSQQQVFVDVLVEFGPLVLQLSSACGCPRVGALQQKRHKVRGGKHAPTTPDTWSRVHNIYPCGQVHEQTTRKEKQQVFKACARRTITGRRGAKDEVIMGISLMSQPITSSNRITRETAGQDLLYQFYATPAS